jgi:hypothetical protein
MLRELVGLATSSEKNHSLFVIYLEKEADFKVKCEQPDNGKNLREELFMMTAQTYYAAHQAILPLFYVEGSVKQYCASAKDFGNNVRKIPPLKCLNKTLHLKKDEAPTAKQDFLQV